MATEYDPTTWLRVSEVARLAHVSERTVRRLIAAGDLPAYRMGAVEIRVARADVDAYLRARPVTGPSPARRRGRAAAGGRR